MKYYIFAANYQHAVYCARIHNINPKSKDFIYVSDEQQLHGLTKNENMEFIFHETFHLHPRYRELLEQVRILEALYDSFLPTSRVGAPQVVESIGIYTLTFWKRTSERVISTIAQTFGAAAFVVSPSLDDINWQTSINIALGAGLLSLLKNLAGSKIGNTSSDPSWVATTKEDKVVDKNSTQSS